MNALEHVGDIVDAPLGYLQSLSRFVRIQRPAGGGLFTKRDKKQRSA